MSVLGTIASAASSVLPPQSFTASTRSTGDDAAQNARQTMTAVLGQQAAIVTLSNTSSPHRVPTTSGTAEGRRADASFGAERSREKKEDEKSEEGSQGGESGKVSSKHVDVSA